MAATLGFLAMSIRITPVAEVVERMVLVTSRVVVVEGRIVGGCGVVERYGERCSNLFVCRWM